MPNLPALEVDCTATITELRDAVAAGNQTAALHILDSLDTDTWRAVTLLLAEFLNTTINAIEGH